MPGSSTDNAIARFDGTGTTAAGAASAVKRAKQSDRHFVAGCVIIWVDMAAMVEISVPDALLKALGAEIDQLPRQTLEALIVQAYRKGQLTHAQVGELLELNRFETDAFLKKAQAFRSHESEEFASDLEILRKPLQVNEPHRR